MLQTKPGRSAKQEQEQNSPNLSLHLLALPQYSFLYGRAAAPRHRRQFLQPIQRYSCPIRCTRGCVKFSITFAQLVMEHCLGGWEKMRTGLAAAPDIYMGRLIGNGRFPSLSSVVTNQKHNLINKSLNKGKATSYQIRQSDSLSFSCLSFRHML